MQHNSWKEGIREMGKRYATVWKAAWDIRKQLDPPKREADELAFLPAHLELVETPLSAAPKWGYRLIMLFFTVTLAWALLGKIDVVASTPGKTVLSGRSKTIKSLEDAGVRTIYVSNGDVVKRGDPLVDLYFFGAEHDEEKYREGLKAALLTRLRSNALLEAIANHRLPTLSQSHEVVEQYPFIVPQDIVAAERLIQGQYQWWATQDEQLSATIRQNKAETSTLLIQIEKLKEALAIAIQQVQDYEGLMANRSISKHAYLNKKQEQIRYETELASSESRLEELNEQLAQHTQQKALLTVELNRDLLERLREADENITQLSVEYAKAQERVRNTHLTAPVSGTVQEVTVHTEGGVITQAEPLMMIVPEEDYLEVEALVPNKDIGFIEEGQAVVIKIESFPYTRYGYLTGTVKSVSLDAIEHEQLGLVFQAMVQVDQDTPFMVEGKAIQLSAGMNVTAEIKIGERRVISYFLSPLQTKIEESLREK